MSPHSQKDRHLLEEIAHRAMLERGLWPEYSAQVVAELEAIEGPATVADQSVRDLRSLPWCSIDNDDSLDLDQLTVAEAMAEERVKIYIAIADVDALVEKGLPVDNHANHNTSSVYTAAKVFSMLPERLSTSLTSLNPHEERLAVVAEMVVGADGTVIDPDIYRARVLNRAKLAYDSVSAWLGGQADMPEPLVDVDGLAENLRLQETAAGRLRVLRHAHGALDLDTIEARPVFEGDFIRDLKRDERNRAKDIIEDFMIAANGVTAQYLSSRGFPSIRRVVRTPRRWDRIIDIAAEHGYALPGEPDSEALQKFLMKVAAIDPLRFPDISLAVVKLLGSGEYVATRPDDTAPGHFGLAVKDYGHSTAPNRRYTDLITQRLLKAAINGGSPAYGEAELDALAAHCTKQEDVVNKVERQVGKSAAALLLASRIGERFEAIVSGAAPKGTWVRLLTVPVEGKLARGFEGADVGDRVRVELTAVDVWRGFIDFDRVGPVRT